MSCNVLLGIDYDELRVRSYRAVTVEGPGDFEKRFATGDVVHDFHEAVVFARQHAREHGVFLMTRSSIDHFVMDTPGYRWSQDGSDLIERAEVE